MKKRILFVDDDPLLVRVYSTVLQGTNRDWDVRGAGSAKEALALMAQQPLDVLVTDLRMPVMSGMELMAEVRRRYPRTSRVILSGVRDQAEVAKTLSDTHQFISKPVDLDTLQGTLARICSLDSFLMDEKLRALIGQFNRLPSFPALYLDIINELAEPQPSIERIAEIVAGDPAMTAKMLHIVNSAAFGLARTISNPLEAVQHLGTGTVRSLALSLHVVSSFEQDIKGFSIQEFADHTLGCAKLSRVIMESMGADIAAAEDAYIAGMLHDIGKLMLASSWPGKYQEAETVAVEQQIPLSAAEVQVFGATHGLVGAYLLGLWGLPAQIVEAVAFHHTPVRSDMRTFGPLAAVHIADVLEETQAQAKTNRPIPVVGFDAEYLVALKVEGRMAAWRSLTT